MEAAGKRGPEPGELGRVPQTVALAPELATAAPNMTYFCVTSQAFDSLRDNFDIGMPVQCSIGPLWGVRSSRDWSCLLWPMLLVEEWLLWAIGEGEDG